MKTSKTIEENIEEIEYKTNWNWKKSQDMKIDPTVLWRQLRIWNDKVAEQNKQKWTTKNEQKQMNNENEEQQKKWTKETDQPKMNKRQFTTQKWTNENEVEMEMNEKQMNKRKMNPYTKSQCELWTQRKITMITKITKKDYKNMITN